MYRGLGGVGVVLFVGVFFPPIENKHGLEYRIKVTFDEPDINKQVAESKVVHPLPLISMRKASYQS